MSTSSRTVIARAATVCVGNAATVVGLLGFTGNGTREHSSFAYDPQWLQSADRFSVSPDLEMAPGHQYHKAASRDDSVFHLGIADTEPDGWGCRVIARTHARLRKAAAGHGAGAALAPLTQWDYLVGVDDTSRIGALRLRDHEGNFLRTTEGGDAATPALLELAHLTGASRAVELGKETQADLRYLQGRGTSLGGLRPKCTLIDADSRLAIGKFPSVTDERSVTKGEVLALRLAAKAGIDAAHARIVYAAGTPVAVVRRFDRHPKGGRIPYLSAASLLQARRNEDRAYTEIADQIVAHCADPARDLAELWRRMAFNLLITNVDDHLHNHAFLHVGHDQWRLSPAFDLNPFPDKNQELKTWLSEETGPVTAIEDVVDIADHFWLKPEQALRALERVYLAIAGWREVAITAAVGMVARDLSDFAPAFEHAPMRRAAKLLGR